ncbi:MAG TPA: hypothetical protein VEJ86_05905 [Candidatus Binataceae bacterium]|nr:hypothetical protein [Candidatus Binataceae bacterium]
MDHSHRFAPVAAVALAVDGVLALATLFQWLVRLSAPRTWDYGPAQLAVLIDLVAHGMPLYRDFRAPPYMPMVYGPLVPWMVARGEYLFGATPLAALELGRVITICATLAVAALIFALARRQKVGRQSAILAALAFVLTPLVQLYGFEFRVDMPALALELGGIAAFGAGFETAAVALLTGEFFVKPGRIAGIVALVACCVIRGQWRRAARLGLLWLATVTAGIATLQLASPWYWLNTFVTLPVPALDFGAPILFVIIAIGGTVGLVIFAALALTRRRSLDLSLRCYLAAALAEDALSCLRWGSNAYYFVPAMAAVAIVAARELDCLLARVARERRWPAQLSAGLGLALLFAGPALLAPDTRAFAWRVAPLSGQRSSPWDPRALARLHQISGPIVTDDADLLLTDTSTNLQWIDLMVLNSMYQRGTFDDSALLDSIGERRIAAFALDSAGLDRAVRGRPLLWPALRDAIDHNYRELPGIGPPYLLTPIAGSRAKR